MVLGRAVGPATGSKNQGASQALSGNAGEPWRAVREREGLFRAKLKGRDWRQEGGEGAEKTGQDVTRRLELGLGGEEGMGKGGLGRGEEARGARSHLRGSGPGTGGQWGSPETGHVEGVCVWWGNVR